MMKIKKKLSKLINKYKFLSILHAIYLFIFRPSQIIFVKDGTKLVKVRLDEIQYIESLKDYVCIHTPSKKIVSLQK